MSAIHKFRPDEQQEPIFAAPHRALGVFGGSRSGKTASLLVSAMAFVYDVPVRFRDGSKHVARLDSQTGRPVDVAIVSHDAAHARILHSRLTEPGFLVGVNEPLLPNCDIVHVAESHLCPIIVHMSNGSTISFLSSSRWSGEALQRFDMVCIDEIPRFRPRGMPIAEALHENSQRFLWASWDGRFRMDIPMVNLCSLENNHIDQYSLRRYVSQCHSALDGFQRVYGNSPYMQVAING